jgi:SAM-dependent methyltransferase
MATLKKYIYQACAGFGIGLFSKLFPEYFANEPLAPSDRYLENYFVVRHLPKAPASVLDVGSSGCFFPLMLAAFGYKTFSVDIRPYPVLKKLSFSDFSFVRADICQAPLRANSFDAVCAISMIEHIGIGGRYGMRDASEADARAVKEMQRILKPGGVLLLTVPCGKPKIIRPVHRIYDRNRIELIAGPHLSLEKAEYYARDSAGDWAECSRESAESIEVKKDDFAIMLVKLRKK